MFLDLFAPTLYGRRIVHYDIALPEELMTQIQQNEDNKAAIIITDGSSPLGNGDYIQYSTLITITDISTLVADLEANGREWLNTIKNRADEQQAELVRKERNRRLSKSDTHMLIDRQHIEVPSGYSFNDWLGFLMQLGNVLTNDWAAYRQALRDLPKQEGFPWDVEWPIEPEECSGSYLQA